MNDFSVCSEVEIDLEAGCSNYTIAHSKLAFVKIGPTEHDYDLYDGEILRGQSMFDFSDSTIRKVYYDDNGELHDFGRIPAVTVFDPKKVKEPSYVPYTENHKHGEQVFFLNRVPICYEVIGGD